MANNTPKNATRVGVRALTGMVLLVVLLATARSAYAVVISGTIKNRLSDTISVSFNTNRIAYYPRQYFAVLARDGSFSMSFDVPEKEYTTVELKHGNRVADLILDPYDTLLLTVNAAHFDSTIHYNGRGSAIQNYVAAHTVSKGRMNQYAMRLKESIPETPTAYLKALERERKAETDYLKLHKKDLPLRFVNYWTAYYEYYNYFFMQQYPQVHEMLRVRRYTDTIPDSNYKVVAQMPLAFHDSLLQLPPYLLYLTGAIEARMKASGFSYFMKDTARVRRFRDSVYKRVYKDMPAGSAEFYAAQGIYAGVRSQPLSDTRALYADFKKHFATSTFCEWIDKQIAITERLEPGQPAPEIVFTDSTGAPVPLSSLRGKVVYLQFWAGFCKQCISEMLREQRVKDLEKNKPVVFAYVSLGDDADGEAELLKKYKIEGIFCRARGGWNSNEAQAYSIQSLPAYFLIDQDGNFALRNPASPVMATQQILEIGKLLK